MNIDSHTKNINISKKYDNKKETELVSDIWLERTNQLLYINNIFLQDNLYNPHIYIKKEINKKISGYLQQDKTKDIYENTSGITFDEVIVKLIESKLKCTYCINNIFVIYNKKLQQDQWTLDRTNNYKGHNNENTVISCLQCNIQRRRTNDKKFLFTKQLIIHKLDK